MTLKRFMLPLLLAVLPARACDPPAPTARPSSAYDFVGVCPIPSEGRSWSVVWHPGASGPDLASSRVFRHLEGPDVDACLTLMILSDSDAHAIVEAYGKNPTREMAVKAGKAVRQRWSDFHVDRAITEVAEDGSRGKEVARVLAACEKIRVPNQIIGTSEGGKK
jgi:hypothetical protein